MGTAPRARPAERKYEGGSLIRRVWTYRPLVYSLVRRQFHLRYRQSFVGFAWALVPPLATLAAGALVFHRVVRVDTGEVPYAIFAMAALVPWTFFANSIQFGVPSVSEALVMVTRLSFPRAALPLSMIGVSLLDLSITIGIFLVFAFAMGQGLEVAAAWFPVLLLIEVVLVVGVVLLGSALNVFARDVRLAVPLLIQLWLFLTPVLYPLESVPPDLRRLYLLNPMTGLVESYRSILIHGQAPDVGLLVPAIVGSVVFFVVGVWYFGSTEPRFADVV
jgi:lipopolysaccharide transport system permease protein